ncbi:G patch domain-containing protein TGH [Carica papaya]|uniref:G patch domain-containing protein TGH n=1 Tax=Carica papaya TaxID=3649 RepID=UPI000B8CEA84|nr:G patch domain-containing protein TGH [Carica papaya]
MESDEEDYVFYGTPIESEEAVTSRKKKAIAEASGQLRTLPPWKQEVRDEEGRRRFHGAFTGGFSAGYYNTVGSKEGWTPQSFTSSRKSRAEVKHQSIFSFLDEDERAELEVYHRPSVIPGPVPDELVLPVTDSIGVKLLLKMGWRRGRSLKDLHANSLHDTRREARKAFLAFSTDDTKVQPSVPVDDDIESSVGHAVNDDVHSSQNTPVYVLNPKQDMHGLGYDPFKHAPEFREKKKLRMSASRQPGHGKASSLKDNLFGFNSGKVAPGFGIGALEELDAEDEDVYASGYNFEETYVEEVEESSRLSADNERKLLVKDQSVLPGFRVASKSDYQLERYDPPVILKDFVAYHKFSGPVETDSRLATPPPEVPPPEDSNLKLLIEGVATLVARCGKLFEDLSREKNQSNPLFGFLNGGNGHEYYVRKLWEEQQKHNDHTKRVFNDKNLSSSVQKMTVDSRGKLLGERPLEKSSRESLSGAVHFQSNLSETFTKPASIMESSEIANPFKDDPAKQERFEQFLKQKYEGGLRSTDSGGANYMSEAARARERLDFEAAAEAIEKGKLYKDGKHSTKQSLESSAIGELQFTSGGLEKTKDTQSENLLLKKMYPKREEFQWRPSPLLCKRFDLIDPYLGKPPPAPRIRSKMDSLLFMPDSFKATGLEETGSSNKDSFLVMQPAAAEINKDFADKEDEVEVEVKNVERPVDLYKVSIFVMKLRDLYDNPWEQYTRNDHRDRYSSRSKGRKKRSSREKSSNKKHSKHHKHRNRSSPHRSSHYSTEKEHAESRREKRKSRN